MKHILEFTLPDDKYDLESATNGAKYRLALDEIRVFLRKKLKYEDLSPESAVIYQEIQSMYWAILQDNEISDQF